MGKFLEAGDPGSFEGLPLLAKPSGAYASLFEKAGLCPKCKGHGGWILKPDAYGSGKHFLASCGHCNGWGWSEVLDHVHEWVEVASLGNCLHEWKCSVCGAKMVVDSSD